MRSDTDWFKKAGWGVFTHYLAETVADGENTTVEDWHRIVNQFEVERLAKQLKEVGAGYYFISIGQISGHYCAPNETYDSLVGSKPGKCSRRDLIRDLYTVLNPLGIKLMVYLPSHAPSRDLTAIERLKCTPTWNASIWNLKKGYKVVEGIDERLSEFQKNWEAIIREWSIRWGGNVHGWWFDGCYYAERMYQHPDPPNFQSFATAAKAGNPDSIVAFNPGVKVPVISLSEYEDYTAGEISMAFPVCPGRWVNGVQYHILSYLGSLWGKGEPRFTPEFVYGYTQDVMSKGGVVTWDVPITREGLIPKSFVEQLKFLGKNKSQI